MFRKWGFKVVIDRRAIDIESGVMIDKSKVLVSIGMCSVKQIENS